MEHKLSYVHGASKVALIGDTIGSYFDHVAKRYAEREALVVRHQGIRWNYRELRERVDNLAAGFLRLGLSPGNRIGIWSQNCAEWVLTQFATAKAGLVMVNINPAYRRAELEYALKKVGCNSTMPSTFSSLPARPACPRALRSPTTIFSTTASSSAKRCASPSRTGCVFRCRSTIASAWYWATSRA